VYNAILRRWPDDIYGPFHSGGNLFATTIFVLVSRPSPARSPVEVRSAQMKCGFSAFGSVSSAC
jgi:hypothetical protein